MEFRHCRGDFGQPHIKAPDAKEGRGRRQTELGIEVLSEPW